jgi:hypothetical protein
VSFSILHGSDDQVGKSISIMVMIQE